LDPIHVILSQVGEVVGKTITVLCYT